MAEQVASTALDHVGCVASVDYLDTFTEHVEPLRYHLWDSGVLWVDDWH